MKSRRTGILGAISVLVAVTMAAPAMAGPQGACCFPDGTCTENQTLIACVVAGGSWLGPLTECDPFRCQPPGACCMPDGSCLDLTTIVCNMQGGFAQTAGTTCAAAVCTGACCFDSGAPCLDGQSQNACNAAGGTFQSAGSTCATSNCPQETQVEAWIVQLSGGMQTLTFNEFDTQAGIRTLTRVTVSLEGQIAANVTVENRSMLIEPNVAVVLKNGAMLTATNVPFFNTVQCTIPETTFTAPPGTILAPQDPNPDQGPDFFNFGLIAERCTASATTTDPAALLTYTGPGTFPIEFTGIGTFRYGGQVPVTFILDPFFSDGYVKVIYEYTVVAQGACCLQSGVCLEGVTQAACQAQGGVFQGVGTTCTPNPCTGACCLPDGTCLDNQTLAQCNAANGAFQMLGSTCAGVVCEVACCLPDGTCVNALPAACIAMSGVPQAPGTTCATAACTGACCLQSGACVDLQSPNACAAQGGQFRGLGSTCTSVRCEGACCLPDGTCLDGRIIAECTAQNGVFQGLGSTCATTRCEGSCCLLSGICLDPITLTECLAQGGNFNGLGSTCTPNPCIGACCLPDETCIDGVTLDQCTAQNGRFQNLGSVCANIDCQQSPPLRSCTEKGSLLVWSKVEIRWNANGQLIQDTFLSLSNDYPGDVRFQMYFINGDPPLNEPGVRFHPGWNWLDNEIELTGDQPTFWSAFTGQPANGGLSPFTVLDPGLPPGRPALDGSGHRVLRGYIVGWAVNALGEEIRWNHISGAATVVNYGGGFAYEYNACAYPAVNPAVAHGGVTGTPGVLNLDSIEYALGPDLLLLNFQAVGSAAWTSIAANTLVVSNTSITLHPLDADLRQDTNGPVTTKAETNVWNENEVKFSALTRCITCWDSVLLNQFAVFPNHFLRANLQTDHGKARIDGVASTQCAGSVEAAITGITTRFLLFNGGPTIGAAATNLHGLGRQPAVILYDVLGPPPDLPFDPSTQEILRFVEGVLGTR